MNMSVRLNNLAAVSTGTARAVFESANAAYRAIFEGEEDELAELSELGNELGDDLSAAETTEDSNATQEPAEQPEQPSPEQSGPAPEPQNVNAQSQPASISADALIKELQQHVKRETAPYKYPRIIEFVDELPKTISGKIRRVEIREKDRK